MFNIQCISFCIYCHFQTPSGTVEYFIDDIVYPSGFFKPSGNTQMFVISKTEGSIYLDQPLTRPGIPDTFTVRWCLTCNLAYDD